MSPDNPKDPFDDFDWSKQDGTHNPTSSTPEDSSRHIPTPPPPPISQPSYMPPSAPEPGTYYSNAQQPFPTTGKLAGTLTAFMVLEWITFGLGISGFCASIPSFFLSGFLATNEFGFTYVIYLLFSTATGLASTIFAFLSGNSIVKRRKVGIKYGWIEVSISWASLIIGTAFSFLFLPNAFEGISGDDSFALSLATSGIGFACGIIFPAAKTILLALPSTKESANRELS